MSSVPHWDFPRNAASVALLVDFGLSRGVDLARLLRGAELDERTLRDPRTTVRARDELQVAQNLIDALGDAPGIGLDVGVLYRIGTFGIFGYACLTSPTIGDAIAFALRYYDLSYGFCLPSVSLDGDLAVVRFELPGLSGPIARFLLERDLAAIRTVLDDLLGGRMPFLSLELAVPRGPGRYRRIFGVTPRFDAEANVATFDASLLSRALPQANRATVAMCEAQCREIVTRHRARSGIAHQVRDQLVRVGGAPRGVADVAAALALSERTLRRRLTEEGTSYRALLEEVQHSLATEMLASGALSVDDVAVRLGYAEASSFIVAFKRWHGMTPAAFARGVRA